ncbi:MAG TPA: hypothetical protein VID47_04430 [Actinomycetota bacterium]
MARRLVAALSGLLAIWAMGGAPAASAAPSAHLRVACGSSWARVPSPNPQSSFNWLTAVDGTGPNDVWAVGNTIPNTNERPLIEHWNGHAWKIVASPTVAGQLTELDGVAAVSTSDAWAVGFTFNFNTNHEKGFLLHWNGSHWTRVATPVGGDHELFSITAVNAKDLFAAGMLVDGQDQLPLVVHFNGTHWAKAGITSPSTIGRFEGISASSSTNVWAVGFHPPEMSATPFAEHFNGHAWHVVSPPHPAHGVLNAVSAVGASGAWAVGSSPNESAALAERFDGSSWTVKATHSPGNNNVVNGVAAASNADVWAVGADTEPGQVTLTEHSSGGAFTRAASVTPGSSATLNAAGVVGQGQYWAVGSTVEGSNTHTLVERRCN